MEQEHDNAGVTRSLNQLHVLPEDWGAAVAVILPLLDRVDADAPTTQVVVLTSDAEAAAGIAKRIAGAAAEAKLRTLAVTDARRATRVQRTAPAHLIVGAPSALLGVLQSATLKLDGLRVVVLAWIDDLANQETGALETFMAEVPKDAARVVLANGITENVDQLVERYARRARRIQASPAEASSPVSLAFVSTSDAARPAALRRLLDAVDPESAIVVARDSQSRDEIVGVLRTLGYDGRSNAVRVADVADNTAQLIIVYDLPATEDDLRRAVGAGGTARVVALVTPRQIGALRRLAGGTVAPFSLPEAAARARSREEMLRDELRGVLAAGQFSRELLAIESLLSDYDGAEIAAAALRLLEAERVRAKTPASASAPAAMTRLFVSVGEMDGVRAGDIVGAITNEAGISKSELGRVDVRERGSTVEVATPVANTVIAKLHGVTIKGRRAMVKVDEERPRRDRPDRPRRMGARGAPDRGGPRKR